MRRFIIIMAVVMISGATLGCSKKESSQSQPATNAKVERRIVNPAQMNDYELALVFLEGIQHNDKKQMYDVSNLTPEMVEESRNKLTDTAKYKLTKNERTATEHALRMSGSIDFFLKKLTKILPKSAQLQVIKTTHVGSGTNTINVHDIKITYSTKEDGVVDKSGKQAREIVVRLQQIRHVVNGHTLQEFVFNNKDFEKMADKDFVVLSYF